MFICFNKRFFFQDYFFQILFQYYGTDLIQSGVNVYGEKVYQYKTCVIISQNVNMAPFKMLI